MSEPGDRTVIPVRHFKPLPPMPLDQAAARGREDVPFFSHYFCGRRLHDGQAAYVSEANATINVLATSNRWGKTTTMAVAHIHPCFYKLDAEPKYFIDGEYSHQHYLDCEYKTIHTAGLWDTAKLVWNDVLKILKQPRIAPFIAATPRTLPPHVEFTNGSQMLFRTLGDHGEGIDGNSFYVVSIDEAGWITNLREIINNVAEIRVADVRGKIHLIGTFKPGISGDFYYYARRASIETGTNIKFDHRATRDYYDEFGLTELIDEVRAQRKEFDL